MIKEHRIVGSGVMENQQFSLLIQRSKSCICFSLKVSDVCRVRAFFLLGASRQRKQPSRAHAWSRRTGGRG